MAEITQKLGFDASQALETLARLDKALAEASKSIDKFAQSAQAFNGVGSQAAKLNKTIESSMNGSVKATERLTVSWGYLTSRILYTQMVVSYFGQFRRALEGAAESAVEYQRKIAEITTISDLSQGGASAIVRNLAEQYNVPLLEEAAGLYQTLSNGITDTAKATQFLAEANKFAKATNSTTANSVDLLSSAIKSFGMTEDDTAKASGVLFEAIRAGRITASELGPVFGRVAPRAAQLGLSLEECSAALSAITVRGVKTSEAITQLNGIITALSKPTDEMTAALRKLNFSSSETAVATLKLPGLLQALADSTDGTSESMAKLFPNLRGVGGELALTGKGLKDFVADLEAMEKAGANQATSKYLQAVATDAEKVTKELNKIKTALTVDLGQSILKATAGLSEWVGGADEVIKIAEAAGPAIIGLGATFIGLRGSALAARAGLAGLGGALGWLSLIPIAIGTGTSLGEYIGGKMVEDAQRGLRQLEEANTKALETFKRQQSEKRDAANKADEQRVQAALRAVQQLNGAYLSEVENARRANDAIVKNAEAGLRQYLTTRERLVDAMAKGVAEANDAIKSSQERVGGLIGKQEERDFTRSISDLTDPEKFKHTLWRAGDMAAEASKALSHAVDKDQIAAALSMFDKAQTTGEQAATIAERTGNRELEVKAAWALDDITKQQIQAERQLQQLQADRAAELEKQRVAQQAIVEGIRTQIGVVLDNSKMFTKEGQLLPPDELAKQAAARQEALQKITATALTSKDLDLTKALGLADFVSRFSGALSHDPIRVAFDTEEGLRKAQADVEKAFQEFKVKVRFDTGTSLETLEVVLGRQLRTPDELARGLTELRTKAGELRAAMDAAVAARKGATDTATATEKAAGESLDRIVARLQGKEGFAAFDEAQKALQQFRNALTDPDLNTEKLRGLVDAVKPLAARTSLSNWGGIYNAQNVTDFTAALEALIKKADALKTLQVPLPKATELQFLESIIQKLKVPPDLSTIGPAIQNGVEPSNTIARNLWSAAEATRQISTNLSKTPNVVGKALGGMLMASGGRARGTDTIPAMLSPGEFIVNARSARRFLPQLTAINANIEPVYHETGGNVTNVGDISISVNETKGPRQTGREVAKALRREFRRGSSRL